MMKWEKLGKIFVPDGTSEWMHTHATIPIVEALEGGLVRVYFSPRDRHNRSHISWVVLDMNNPLTVIDVASKPIIAPGSIGAFDDSGAMANSLITVGSRKYLFYQGCNLGVTIPFRNSIGLAISDDNGETFQKFADGPIVDRTYKEPHFTATADVLYEDGTFKMWYLSCVRWELIDDKPKHYYHIKYAESIDAINWNREGIVAIDFKNDEEYAIGVPRVIKEDGVYKMWYCYRGHRYRIGYAESTDGKSWIRKDELMDFGVSDEGWDSDMVEYPYIYDYKGERFLFYNGNNYGKTGFGIARLIKQKT